jgi:hypothetical protein
VRIRAGRERPALSRCDGIPSAYWYIAMRAAIGFRRRRRLTRNLPRYKTRRIVPSTTPTTVPMILTIFKIALPPPPLSPIPLTL